MTEFRYFADPRASTASTWTDEAQACAICGEVRPGYSGEYGADRDEVVCEECIASGRLAHEREIVLNEGDVIALREQLEADPRAAELERERTDELEHRTPGLVTWQPLFWPAHCGDYCRFEREVGKPELTELGGGDGDGFFREHLHPDAGDGLEWDEVPDEAPPSRHESNSPSVYLFRCLRCSTPVLWWDVD